MAALHSSSNCFVPNSPWILVLSYVPLGASFYYVPMKNNLQGLAVTDILEAGRIVGAGDFAILRRIVLPSILPSLMVGLIIVAAVPWISTGFLH